MCNQLLTGYKVNVSLEVEGCATDSKFQAFYFQAGNWGDRFEQITNKPMQISDDARDPVSLILPGLGSYDLVVELVSTDGLDRVVSASIITLQAARTKKRRRFCYLIQAPEPVEVSHLKTSESEVIQLVWRGLGGDELDGNEAGGILFYPNSSLVQGRNRLFHEIQIRFPDVEFQYAVFLDDDVELEEVKDYGMNTGNAWRTFERYFNVQVRGQGSFLF